MQLIVVVVLLVLLGLTTLAHWYLWRRLVRDTTGPGRARRTGTAAIALLAVLVPATLVGSRALHPGTARWLAWPGYVWLALFFYLLLGVVLLDVIRLVARLVGALAGRSGQGGRTHADAPGAATAPTATATATVPAEALSTRLVSRRLVLARSGAALVGTAALGTVGYGLTQALGPPRILPLTVSLPRLPAALDGLRIAVVSDIHLGPLRGRAHTERIVNLINEQRADLVAVVGDLVDGSVPELGEAAAPLRDLVSAHGSFFVTGNHEYFSGAQAWIDEVARLGLRPLVNERAEIRVGDAVLDLAGVNDVTGGGEGHGPDYDRALGGRDPNRPVVLLAHQPVQVHEAQARGVDLQLSGHTHGGQLFPFHGIVRLQQPVLAGLSRLGDTQLFVTRGAGFWGPPVRVGAPPEIAIVRLTPGQA